MADLQPTFKIFESDGVTEVYEFEKVLNWQPDPFADPFDFVEHTSLRGQGSIISEGSDAPWDLTLDFLLTGDDYEDLASQMNSLPSTIVRNKKYFLKVQLTTGGSTKDLKVKRLRPIRFPLTRRTKAVTIQDASITLRVESWA